MNDEDGSQFFTQNTLDNLDDDDLLQYFSNPPNPPNDENMKQVYEDEQSDVIQSLQSNRVYSNTVESNHPNSKLYTPQSPPPLIASILSQRNGNSFQNSMNHRKRRAGSFAGYPSMHYTRDSLLPMSREVDDFEGTWDMNGFPNIGRDDTQNRVYALEERIKFLEEQNALLRTENFRLLHQLSVCIKNDNK